MTHFRFTPDPYKHLQRLVNVILRIISQETDQKKAFLSSFALDPDYSEATMRNVAQVLLQDDVCAALSPQVEEFINQVLTR